jgi:hypothetical protein
MNTPLPPPGPTPGSPTFDRGKRAALLFSLAFIGVVLWPVMQNWRDEPRDNFPLSYYPMFSNKREPIETFYYVVGLDAQGQRYYMKHTLIGDGGGNQVRRQLRRIISEGRAPELAKDLAGKLARRDKEPWSKVVKVAVCSGKYSVDDFFHGKKSPVQEKIRGSATVERSSR